MTKEEITAYEGIIDERARAWLSHIDQCDDRGNYSSYGEGFLDGIEFAMRQLEEWIKKEQE